MSDSSCKTLVRLGWPLCCAYVLLLVESLGVEIWNETGGRFGRQVHWAFGVLSNGDYEVLGAWPESPLRGIAWNRMQKELELRGVERIGLVVARVAEIQEPLMDQAPVHTIRPALHSKPRRPTSGGTAQAGDRGGGRQQSVSAGPEEMGRRGVQQRGRSIVMSVDQQSAIWIAQKAAQHLGQLVSRSVARHGAFLDVSDATTFVVDALSRAEQKSCGTVAPIKIANQSLAGAARPRPGGCRAAESRQ